MKPSVSFPLPSFGLTSAGPGLRIELKELVLGWNRSG